MVQIGKYEIRDVLGRGGMGVVYRGFDRVIERDVAIKLISKRTVNSEQSRRRFLREARSAGRLSHPNITTVYDVGEEDGRPYIVMEFLDGYDLSVARDAGESIPLLDKLQMAVEICSGLHFAHERGIIHRDIKPDNIHVLRDGRVKIIDFGIARMQDDVGTVPLTVEGTVMGTPNYMSPEQFRGETLDRRSDIFSFGVVLFELIQGISPFKGKRYTVLMYSILNEDPKPIDVGPLPWTREVEKIVIRCLEKDPDERYQSCADIIKDLNPIMNTLESSSARLSSVQMDRLLEETVQVTRAHNADVRTLPMDVLPEDLDPVTGELVPELYANRRRRSGSERSTFLRPSRRLATSLIGILVVTALLWGISEVFDRLPSVSTESPETRSSTSLNAAPEPIETRDSEIRVPEDGSVEITLTELVATVSLDSLLVEIIDDPVAGSAIVKNDTMIAYAPDANYHGSDEFGFVVVAPSGQSDRGTISLIVEPVNDAPVFTTRPTATVLSSGDSFSYDVSASDIDGDDLSISSQGLLPAWLELRNRGNGLAVLVGTPTEDDAGTHDITLIASDNLNPQLQSFTLSVAAKQPIGDGLPRPALVRPMNGAEGVARRPVLEWTLTRTGNVSGLDLQISTDGDFDKDIVLETPVYTMQYRSPELEEGSTYFWRVRAINSAESSPWSEVRSFTTRRSDQFRASQTVLQILSLLRTAFVNEDLDALEAVHEDYVAEYSGLFLNQDVTEMSTDHRSLQVESGSATVEVTISIEYGSGTIEDTRRWHLQERNGEWVINSMTRL